jgi:LAO/AO transport system kinase
VSSGGAALAARLRARDLTAAPATLNLLESTTPEDREQSALLLAELSPAKLGEEAPAHIVGVTGPPGAGKSTLLSALLRRWREQDRTVAMLAVDPSSRRSGGSLLGDRARVEFDPADRGVLIRSTAAGDRLGGLAWATRAAAQALAAAFDAVIVQPGGGDSLQFLKSGIMEIPDVLVVTKSDLGQIAMRTRRDLSAALRSLGSHTTDVLALSCIAPVSGVKELAQALDRHRAEIDLPARRLSARRASALTDFALEHGESGLRALGGRRSAQELLAVQDSGLDVPALVRALEDQMG